ncbi:MAG: hypothetical protein J6R42_00770 [Clostridia bacterium]|nr:hypothetical protein [Clostridia bacterium]
MNKSAQKIAFMLLMIVVLAAIFSVTAFAADGAEASSSMDKVNQITDKVAQYSSDIKAQLKELNEKVKGLLGSAAEYLPLVLGVLLLLECFFGYKLLGLQMFLAGGYIGFAVGLIGYTHLLSADILMPEPTKWVLAGVLAILMALLFMALKKAGLVIFAGVFAFVKLANYTDKLVVQVALTAVVVVLSIFFFKYLFIHTTSLYGGTKGMMLIMSSSLVSGMVDLNKFVINTPKEPAFYLGLLVAFFGIFAQLKMAKKKYRY